MTLEERIAANAKKGYLYVGTINDENIWKKFDGNTTVYYLDEGYEECLPIWNTLRSHEILKLLYKDLTKLK